MPDPSIPTEETGTRHRTADRVARADRLPGDLGVASRCRSSRSYVGETRYVLEDSGRRSCRAPTRRWPPSSATSCASTRSSGTLSALEIEDLVTVRDVAVGRAAARDGAPDRRRDRGLRRRARHRRPAAVAAARGAGHRRRARSASWSSATTCPRGRRVRSGRRGRARRARGAVARPTCSTSAAVARALGLGLGEHLDGAGRARAATGCWPRCRGCPRTVVDRLVEHFGTPAEAARRQHRRPADRRRRRRARGPAASARGCPGSPSRASSSATSEISGQSTVDFFFLPWCSLCGCAVLVTSAGLGVVSRNVTSWG